MIDFLVSLEQGRVLDFLSVDKPNQGTRNGIYAVITN